MAVGSFLDYGAYASFAPVFDSEAGEVGDQDLADYLYSKRVRKANRRTSLKATVAVVVDEDADTVMEIAPEKEESKVGSSSGSSSPATGLVIDPALEMEDELRAAMAQVQLETGIDDLLARNASAIQSLVQLQSERYKIGAKAPKVEVGGEEWKLGDAVIAFCASSLRIQSLLLSNLQPTRYLRLSQRSRLCGRVPPVRRRLR